MKRTNKSSEISKIYPCPKNPIPENVRSHIEAVATDMVHHSSHSKSDFEDICQDLSLAVIRAFEKYDCTRSRYYTYAQAIIRNTRNTIYRKRISKGHDVSCSPIDSVASDDPILVDVNMPSPAKFLEYKENQAQIQDVLSELNPLHRKICVSLMDGLHMREIIASCQLSPSQFYHRIWPELRREFKRKLKKVQKTPHNF